jgi:two-component system response regulator EvgA
MTSVLIVDDHAGFRRAAARMLVQEGFEIAGQAPDGAAGLASAIALGPDVVLLDVGLPDQSGLEVARQVREQAPAAAVVLISTRDAGDYEERAAATGAAGFLAKGDLSGDALRGLLAAD